jgi:hypothetical protein
LKQSEIRLIELASYLGVSRPTLYKYLELYEQKEYSQIEKKCLDFFSFVDNSKNAKRPMIMDYLINKVIPFESIKGNDVAIISAVRKLSESPKSIDQKKMKVIDMLATSNKLDEIVDQLLKHSESE